jgi:hypothetical protein
MKKLSLFLLFTFTSIQGFSQFYEGFEGDSFPPAGWLVTGSGTSFTPPIVWTKTGQSNTGNWAAYMTRYNIGTGNTSQDWLITPQISVSSFNDKLFFSSRTTLAGNQGTLYQVRVSTNSNPANLNNFTIIQQYTENEINTTYNVFKENSIDLDAFAGQNIHIAFVRVHTQPTTLGGDRWVLDDIYIAHESLLTPFNPVLLVAFRDINNNGVKDIGEHNFSLGSFSYQLNSQAIINGFGSGDGAHYINEPSTYNYNFSFQVNPAYTSYYYCNTTYSGTIDSSQIYPTFYFPVTVLQDYTDLKVNIYGTNQARPGFSHQNIIVYKNIGHQTIPSGTLTFTKDDSVTITNITQTGTVPNPTGFTYDFINLAPDESRQINVTLLVPTIPVVNLGDIITNCVNGTIVNDADLNNNEACITQVVVGSYDPNDKMENHGPTINIDEFGANDYLYYTIRFENTGTAAADFVRIKDSLHSSLNPSTFEMIDASHTYSATRLGNQIEWFFDDINLPPTSQNQNLSRGFVHFKIKPNPGFEVGDIIPNTAEIYFDYNPAIITNTFETEFVTVLSVTDYDSFQVAVYPNPTNEFVHVELDKSTEVLQSIVVYDLLGKQVLSITNLSATSENLDISKFKSGTYLLEITTQTNLKTTKKLVIR